MKVEKMKESRRWLSWLPKALLATLLAGALAFVGCKSDDDDDDDDSGTSGPVAVTSVTVSPTTLELSTAKDEQKTGQLTATVTPPNADNKSVDWTSNKESVATVDKNGLVTAVGEGEAIITVTTKDGKKTATCTVTVSKTELTNVITAITIAAANNATTLTAGDTLDFTATVTPDAAKVRGITWDVTSTPEGIATKTVNATDSTKMTLTTTGAGTVTITAKAASGSTVSSNTVTITVKAKTPDVTPDDPDEDDDDKTAEDYAAEDEEAYGEALYELSFADVELDDVIGVQSSSQCASEITADGTWRHYFKDNTAGNSGARVAWLKTDLTEYTAEHSYVLAFDAALTQMSSNKKDMFLVNTEIQENGTSLKPYLLYMAAASEANSWNINALNSDETPFGAVTLEAGKFYHYTLKVVAEENRAPLVLLTIAGVKDEAGNPVKDVYLKVNGTSYAAKSFCLGTGLGTGTEQKLKNVKIYNYENPPLVPATKVEITNKEALEALLPLSKGGTLKPEVTLTPFYTTDTVKWSSTNSNIVAVDEETGLITAKDKGTETITATAGTKSDTIEIEVTDKYVPVKSVKITTTTKKIGLTQPVTFKAEVTPPNATNANKLKWSIKDDDGSIAEINPATGVVTGKKEGKVTIVATVEDGEDGGTGNTQSDESEVTVVLFVQDFENVDNDDATKVATSPNLATMMSIETDDSGNKYFQFKQNNANGRNAYLSLQNIPESGSYCLKFDAAMAPGSEGSTNQPSQFAVVTADVKANEAASSNYLLALKCEEKRTTDDSGVEYTWKLNDEAGTSIMLASHTFYTFVLNVDIDGETVTLTIYNADGSTKLEAQTLKTDGSSLVATKINMLIGRYYNTHQKLDNIVVKSAE